MTIRFPGNTNVSYRVQLSLCNCAQHIPYPHTVDVSKVASTAYFCKPCGCLYNTSSWCEAFALFHIVQLNIVAHRTSPSPSTMDRELVRKNESCKSLPLHYGSPAISWITRIAASPLASQTNQNQQLTSSIRLFNFRWVSVSTTLLRLRIRKFWVPCTIEFYNFAWPTSWVNNLIFLARNLSQPLVRVPYTHWHNNILSNSYIATLFQW